MLNPSTADHAQDDPTIRRCIGFAHAWGYRELSVRNLFAYRATYPRELLTAYEPTGGTHGDQELLAALTADRVILAWGAGAIGGRDRQVLDLFMRRAPHASFWCLGLTKHEHPRHPLYVSAAQSPLHYVPPSAGIP